MALMKHPATVSERDRILTAVHHREQAAEKRRKDERPDLVLMEWSWPMTAERLRLGEARILDMAFYADEKPVEFSENVSPALLLLAGIQSLTEKEAFALRKIKDKLYRVQSAQALSPFHVMLHLLAIEAKSELRMAQAA